MVLAQFSPSATLLGTVTNTKADIVAWGVALIAVYVVIYAYRRIQAMVTGVDRVEDPDAWDDRSGSNDEEIPDEWDGTMTVNGETVTYTDYSKGLRLVTDEDERNDEDE